jgi:hypothetical protein
MRLEPSESSPFVVASSGADFLATHFKFKLNLKFEEIMMPVSPSPHKDSECPLAGLRVPRRHGLPPHWHWHPTHSGHSPRGLRP